MKTPNLQVCESVQLLGFGNSTFGICQYHRSQNPSNHGVFFCLKMDDTFAGNFQSWFFGFQIWLLKVLNGGFSGRSVKGTRGNSSGMGPFVA